MTAKTKFQMRSKPQPHREEYALPCMIRPEISQQTFEKYRNWLEQTVGISLSDNKKQLLVGRLSSRMKALGIDQFEEYFDRIEAGRAHGTMGTEHQVAIDLLTTNETYFFREASHFDFIRTHCLPIFSGGHIRCLSAASSSGEEAYSLAFLLAQYHRGDWCVEGCDVSERVIKKATSAVYPIDCAAQIPRPYLINYCRKGKDSQKGYFKIADSIRKQVAFYKLNLLTDKFSSDLFDLVLLRNILIYFNQETKQKIINNIHKSIKPGGYLIIGHSDSLTETKTNLNQIAPSIFVNTK